MIKKFSRWSGEPFALGSIEDHFRNQYGVEPGGIVRGGPVWQYLAGEFRSIFTDDYDAWRYVRWATGNDPDDFDDDDDDEYLDEYQTEAGRHNATVLHRWQKWNDTHQLLAIYERYILKRYHVDVLRVSKDADLFEKLRRCYGQQFANDINRWASLRMHLEDLEA